MKRWLRLLLLDLGCVDLLHLDHWTSGFLLFANLLANDAHFTHELLLLDAKHFLAVDGRSLLPVLRNHLLQLLLVNDDLRDTVVAFARHSIRSDLLLVQFPPLDDLVKSVAHVVELEVCARLWAGVLAIRVVIKVDAFVVQQVSLALRIRVCHC